MSWLRKVKGSRNWYVVWREDGRERLRSTGTRERTLAERIRRQVDREIVKGRWGIQEKISGPTLAAAAAAYLEHSHQIHRPKTTAIYGWCLGRLRQWLGERADGGLSEIGAGDCLAFMAESRAAGLRHASVGILGRHLRRFFQWCMEQGWCAANPMPRPKCASAARGRYLDLDEVRALLNAEEDADAADLWRFLLLTGARIGETCALRWTDIDWTAGLVFLRSQTTKSRRNEEIEISPELRALLADRRARSRGERLWPWSGSWASHRFKRTARLAGIEDVSLHCLRHTAASWLVMSGVSLKVVSSILRHSSSAVTEQYYAHLASGVRAAAMSRSPLAQIVAGRKNADE